MKIAYLVGHLKTVQGKQKQAKSLLLSSKEKRRGCKLEGDCINSLLPYVGKYLFCVLFCFNTSIKESKTQGKVLSITITHIDEGASVE